MGQTSVDIIKIWQPKLLSDMVLQIKKKKLWTDSELKDQIIAHKDQHHSALALCSPIPGCCCALKVYNQIIRPRILLVCANLDNFTMVSAHQWF